MNISSIVVQTLPKYLDSVIENLKKSGVCDYHMHDEKGRIIITIEGKNVEEELSNHMEVLENADLVPKVLNDKDIKVEDMIYRGDLKRKDLIGFAKEFDRTEK